MRRLDLPPLALLLGGFLLPGGMLPCAPARAEPPRKSFLGEKPPELVFEAEWWINTEPLTLEQLRGKVVWLQYHF